MANAKKKNRTVHADGCSNGRNEPSVAIPLHLCMNIVRDHLFSNYNSSTLEVIFEYHLGGLYPEVSVEFPCA
jgi:hypothetical protein